MAQFKHTCIVGLALVGLCLVGSSKSDRSERSLYGAEDFAAPSPFGYAAAPVVPVKVSQSDQVVPVSVPQPYFVHVARHVPVPVPQPVPVSVPRPVPVAVPHPVPVTVNRPYPVDVPRSVPYSVPHPVPYSVSRPVPYDVPHPYPVEVHQHVPYSVPTPVVAAPVHGFGAKPFAVGPFRYASATGFGSFAPAAVSTPLSAFGGSPYGHHHFK